MYILKYIWRRSSPLLLDPSSWANPLHQPLNLFSYHFCNHLKWFYQENVRSHRLFRLCARGRRVVRYWNHSLISPVV